MQVTCEQCGKSINIPDEKVPRDKAFNLTCPGCKNKIHVDQHLKQEEPDDLGEDAAADTLFAVTEEYFEEDESPPIYDENDKVALIMDPRNYDTLAQVLTDFDYKLETARSPEHGVHKLKFFHYNVVIFHEHYGVETLEESPLYKYILDMPMTTRRKTFIAMIGQDLKSADHLQALAYSVNQVINEKDLDKLDILLKKGITDNDIFYRIFRETMEALGRV